MEVCVGAAPEAVPLVEGTTVAEREVLGGAVAEDITDDTDADAEDKTEEMDEDIDATLDTADVVAGADVGATELLAADVGAAVPLVLADCPRQLESELDWTVTGEEKATAPVESRSWKVIEVPAAMFAVHVRKVPLCCPKSWRAAAPAWPPGMMLTNTGVFVELQVICTGWH